MSSHRQFHFAVYEANGGAWPDFEGLVRDIYVSILKPGNVALDVGVNQGDHFLQMPALLGPKGLVIGIEASPVMVEITRGQVVQQELDKRCEIVLHNVAVSDKEGTAQFHFVKSAPGLSSLANRDVAQNQDVEVFECRLTTIDNLLSPVRRKVDFAKLDIEGAEYHALKGASRLLTRDRPPIVFEFDKQSPEYFGYRCEDLIGLFESAGYKIHDFFGFTYTTPQDLMDSGVWNYFAAPSKQIERFRVKELVAASLSKQGIVMPQPSGV